MAGSSEFWIEFLNSVNRESTLVCKTVRKPNAHEAF